MQFSKVSSKFSNAHTITSLSLFVLIKLMFISLKVALFETPVGEALSYLNSPCDVTNRNTFPVPSNAIEENKVNSLFIV